MATYNVAVIPGDGIGPEVIEATITVLEATGIKFNWEYIPLNPDVMKNHPHELPLALLQTIKNNGRALKGPISTPIGGGFTSPSVLLRRQLGLQASIRPVKAIKPSLALRPKTDVIIVREITEDLYVMREHASGPDSVTAEKLITRPASERAARTAFSQAKNAAKIKVTALHKADILKLSDGLFLEASRTVAKDYPEIDYEEATIDSACMELILDPTKFEVVVAPNMYGDIFSDVAAGLVGGLGMIGSVNIGDGPSIYEAVHGSAPNIAGKGIANPTGMILSALMMLRDLGEVRVAGLLEEVLSKVINQDLAQTPDLGGTSTTQEFTSVLVDEIKKQSK